jgi:hypothetical protein
MDANSFLSTSNTAKRGVIHYWERQLLNGFWCQNSTASPSVD